MTCFDMLIQASSHTSTCQDLEESEDGESADESDSDEADEGDLDDLQLSPMSPVLQDPICTDTETQTDVEPLSQFLSHCLVLFGDIEKNTIKCF